nr:hypothetical protein [Vibrio ostreicida]
MAAVRAQYRGGMFHIPKDALQCEPLAPKAGFAVVAVLNQSGQAFETQYVEDHRQLTIYDQADSARSQVVSELGPIESGFTSEKPETEFDEWVNGAWVTNVKNQYITQYNQVDDRRRAAYQNMVAPLTDEAYIKRHLIQTAEAIVDAEQLEKQALAARLKIQAENPWPAPLTDTRP